MNELALSCERSGLVESASTACGHASIPSSIAVRTVHHMNHNSRLVAYNYQSAFFALQIRTGYSRAIFAVVCTRQLNPAPNRVNLSWPLAAPECWTAGVGAASAEVPAQGGRRLGVEELQADALLVITHDPRPEFPQQNFFAERRPAFDRNRCSRN